jgi:hypothetical protein
VGLAATKPLKARACHPLATARRLFREQGDTLSVFGDTHFKTQVRKRRVMRVPPGPRSCAEEIERHHEMAQQGER